MGNNIVGDELYLLDRTPSLTLLTYQVYETNGNTFYKISQDKKSTNQTVVSALMQQTPIGQRTHIMVT